MVMTRQTQKKAPIFAAGDKYTLWPQPGHVLPAHFIGRTANSESSVGLFSRSSRAYEFGRNGYFYESDGAMTSRSGPAPNRE